MRCLKILSWVPYYLIFLCDMSFMIHTIDIASYADDNTPDSVGKKPM